MSTCHTQPNENPVCTYLCMLSCVRLFAAPWTVAHQAPLSMGFSKQEYWRGFSFPTPGDLPDRDRTRVLTSAALAGRFFTIAPRGILNTVQNQMLCTVPRIQQTTPNNHPTGHQVAKEPSF